MVVPSKSQETTSSPPATLAAIYIANVDLPVCSAPYSSIIEGTGKPLYILLPSNVRSTPQRPRGMRRKEISCVISLTFILHSQWAFHLSATRTRPSEVVPGGPFLPLNRTRP